MFSSKPRLDKSSRKKHFQNGSRMAFMWEKDNFLRKYRIDSPITMGEEQMNGEKSHRIH